MIYYIATFLVAAGFALNARADEAQMKFNYSKADLATVIEDYAKASGQRFIWDDRLVGRVTVLNPGKVSLDEAFSQLSTVLATNGYGISRQGEVLLVQPARSIQRNFIDMGNTLPPLRPERMFTYVIDLKHADADRVNRELRILTSKDGELVPIPATNQILVTDWVSNLHRIQKIIEAVDRPSRERDPKSAWNEIVVPPQKLSEDRNQPIM